LEIKNKKAMDLGKTYVPDFAEIIAKKEKIVPIKVIENKRLN
jgi:hypothetical protein